MNQIQMKKAVLNEKPFEHRSYCGTVFTASRCDLGEGVHAKVRKDLKPERFAQDVAEMIGYHAGAIVSELNGFAGYSMVKFTIEYY